MYVVCKASYKLEANNNNNNLIYNAPSCGSNFRGTIGAFQSLLETHVYITASSATILVTCNL